MPNNDFTHVIRGLIKQEIDQIHTALPAKVINVKGMDIDVQPTVMLYQNGNHRELPIIHSVPFMPPQTKSAGIRWNPQIGDDVLLMVCEMSIDNIMAGDGKTIVKSEDGRAFDLSDAVAINGFLNSTENLPLDPTVGIEIHSGEQTIQIKKDGTIVLGSGAVTQALLTEAFKLALDTHTHTAPSGATSTPIYTVAETPLNPFTTIKVRGE